VNAVCTDKSIFRFYSAFKCYHIIFYPFCEPPHAALPVLRDGVAHPLRNGGVPAPRRFSARQNNIGQPCVAARVVLQY